MIRVFLVDDHAVVRHGLRKLLTEAGDIRVVGEAGDGRPALEALTTLPCDVVILDLSLPRFGGLEVLRRLRQLRPELRVLVLSMYAEEQYAARLLREGAAGYVAKDRPPEELIAAIRRVAAGKGWVPAEVASDLRPPHETFTSREHQVFLLLCQGRAVTDIAAELDLSKSTVSTYVQHLKEKLDVRTIGDIIRYGHGAGLVP